METWIGFVIAGSALAGSPGPATLSLAATGAAFGSRRGLAYMLGILVGMIVVTGIVSTGVLGILLTLPGAAPVAAVAAAAYFVYLAFRIATAAPLSAEAGQRRPPSFAAGMLLSLVNPKGYAAMTALFSGFTLAQGGFVLDIAAKLGLLTMIIGAVDLGWLLAGAALTRLYRDPAANRAINIAFALLLLASAALALAA